MAEPVEMLEQRIDALRARIRQALMAGDRDLARSLRRELREADSAWEDALADLENGPPGGTDGTDGPPGASGGRAGGSGGQAPPAPQAPPPDRARPLTIPLREQVHHALTLLTVPSGPKLISAVHEAFFTGPIPGARLTSLRRDEERSFRAAPFARPYYLCAALTADLLAPARGLLAVSTWPLELRILGSLSSRAYFLISAIRVAQHMQRLPEPSPAAARLLWRFGANIPGGAAGGRGRVGAASPPAVIRAAGAELHVHQAADEAARRAAAQRARDQLDHPGQLFGSRLRESDEQRVRPA